MSSSSLELCPQPARPDHRPREFIPLRGEGGERFDGDAQIQLFLLCAKCKSLEGLLGGYLELAAPLAADPGPPTYEIKEHYPTLGLLRDSFQRGCHLCTVMWDSLMKPGNYAALDSDEGWGGARGGALSIELQLDLPRFILVPLVLSSPSSTTRGCMICIEPASKPVQIERAIPTSAVSTRAVTGDVSFYRRCADICDSSHTRCHVKRIDRLPTRLLHVEAVPDGTGAGTAHRVQLVSAENLPADAKYAALSYCWGEQHGLRLTESNYQDLTADIPYGQLPATIQDSVAVTTALGLQYIWVDALCIVQDSPGDWSREASKMCDVYQGCSVALAASGAPGSGDGLFAVRDPLRQVPCRLLGTMHARSWNSLVESPWALETRGWAIQEQLLPARSVRFGSYLVWECRELIMNEFWVEERPEPKAQPYNGLPIELYPLVLEPRRSDPVNLSGVRDLWYRILTRYSRTSLSVKGDKLVAIAGLGSAFERRTGWRLVHGLWEPFIIQDLLWRRSDGGHCDPTGLRPSWSWASQHGDLSFSTYFVLIVRTYVAECVGIRPFGNSRAELISPAAMELNGVMCRTREAEKPHESPHMKHLRGDNFNVKYLRAEGWPAAILLMASYDRDDRPWTDGDMILPLSVTVSPDWWPRAEGLLVVPTIDPTAFERVGAFDVRVLAKQNSREREDAERFLEALARGGGEPLVRQRILLI
ncbi:hypothetical protein VPNG_00894 [Cytospora leucostoma]|uniref:Heterokaryon incompatibility domain-containing protein n=1 Tax=Cytospora leucostoma TaxID=1230097 RepID=A0A423XLU9_9PEZI|nr:hypothetical protein VPNG_00894 [Cytospora leucostoma]